MYSKTVLLPNLYSIEDYNKQTVSQYHKKYTENMVSVRLGPPRLRQIRVIKGNTNLQLRYVQCAVQLKVS